MSSKGKWVSARVQQHQQQVQQPSAPRPGNSHSTANPAPGSKIMEDSAIAAQRIKESHAAGTAASPGAEMPAPTSFERQEATDALSNLAHNEESTPYEPRPGKVAFAPAQTKEAFNEKMLRDLEKMDS